jgi:PHD/YefM family antitoxin component YafN of YafNO toxin-antitoxin module
MRELVENLEKTGEPVLVTRRGRPAGVLYPLSEEDLEDFVLAHGPEFTSAMREADEELAEGRTLSLRETLAEHSRVDLSGQEVKILSLLIHGEAIDEVAENLHISHEAATPLIRQILSKLAGLSEEEIERLTGRDLPRHAQGPAGARRGQ